jgi:hypothetical protein
MSRVSKSEAFAHAKLLISDDGKDPSQENTEYNRAVVELLTAMFKGSESEFKRREIAEELELDFNKLYN